MSRNENSKVAVFISTLLLRVLIGNLYNSLLKKKLLKNVLFKELDTKKDLSIIELHINFD